MPSLEQKKVRKSDRRFFVRTLDVHLDFFLFFFFSPSSPFFLTSTLVRDKGRTLSAKSSLLYVYIFE